MLALKMAFRNLLRHKRRSILCGLTLLCGYALLSLSEATSAGTYSTLIEAFTREHTGHAQIHRQGYLDRPMMNKAVGDPDKVARVLENTPGVVAFAPRILGPALAYLNNKTTPVEIRGIDLEKEPLTTKIREKLKLGRFPDSAPDRGGRYGVLLGASAADNLKASIGDELVLISQGADGSVANDIFIITGTIGTPDSRDRMAVYMPLDAARLFFTLPGQVHEFAIIFKSHKQAGSGARKIEERLVKAGGSLSGLSVEPWQVVEADFYRGMQVDKKGNFITYIIILFIVAVGVLNVILMAILERTREFGVLKAMGTRPRDIFSLIVLETALLALLSTAAGLFVAIPVNLWFKVYGYKFPTPVEMGGISMDRVIAEVSVTTLAGPALMVIVASVLICLWPAVRAARIRVVDALRSV